MSGEGLQKLLYQLHSLVEVERSKQAVENAESAIPIIRAVEDVDQWKIIVEDFGVVVRGKKIERFANRTYFDNEDAVRRLRDIMRKMGIIRSFEKQKIETDTKVYFGDNREDYLEY